MQRPQGRAGRAVVFVAIVLLVVAGTTVVSVLGFPGAGAGPAEYPEYAASKLVPDRSEAVGLPEAERVDDPGVVLVDSAHVNRFEDDDVQLLLSAITATGYRIDYVRSSDDFDAALSKADAFLVIDPALRYRPDEVDRVESFVEGGGRVVMLGEPRQSALSGGGPFATIVTRENRLGTLATRFGIQYGTGYLYNMGDRDGNFRNVFAESRSVGPVAEGVDRAAFYTATSVSVSDGSTVLVATDGTRNVRGDVTGEFAVAVRTRNVLAIGDTTFLEHDNYNVVDNDRLIGNIARFLTSGTRTRTIVDYPYTIGDDPQITYTSVDFLDAAQSVAGDVRETGADPTLRLRRGAGAVSGTDVLVTSYDYLESNPAGVGVTASRGRVAVAGYESDATGVIVFRAPRNGPDLVIVVDDADKARRAASILESGDLSQYVVDDATAIVRTASTEVSAPPDTTGNETAGNVTI